MLERTESKPELQQMGRILARVKKRLIAILNYGYRKDFGFLFGEIGVFND